MIKVLLEKASMSGSGNTMVVDIVKDVINRASVYWAANFVVCSKASRQYGIVYARVSLVCLSPCSTAFWEGTR